MRAHSASLPEAVAGSHWPLQAVLFDMDGVVTDTARAHAAAWQRMFDEFLRARAQSKGEAFRPFDIVRDYRLYVDGKPRHDGVRSLLESRGIALPYGSEDDGPDAQTVCGLGNRKNRHFRAWLEQNRVQAYPGTLQLVRALRQAGVKTAVYSASRNAGAVLRNAGVLELFDSSVGGSDLARLELPGKPDPAMLHEAASRLGVPAERCAVVEDAIAGVEAGAKGGFGLVIGVDRGDCGGELRQAGAHIVVHDLGELVYTAEGKLAVKTLANLPSAWKREGEILRRLTGMEPVVFLDYDGTLTPIVEDHTKAFLSEDMRAAVDRLSECCTVAVVSGRDLGMLKSLVGLGSVYYVGSHGFEIAGPAGSSESMERGVEFLPDLDEAERALREQLAGIGGHAVERKRFSVAVHFRRVAVGDLDPLEAVVDRVLAEHPRLRRGYGKKVYELRPGIDWNKGRAVLWLLNQLGLARPEVLPIYVGDDVTDEDAFRALAGRGLGFAVRDDGMRQTAADYAVTGTREVGRLLDLLTEIATEAKRAGGMQP